jgi:hypothetical protein
MNTIYQEEQAKLDKLSKRKNIKREELLFILNRLSDGMPIEGFSHVLNFKERLGFKRHEGE